MNTDRKAILILSAVLATIHVPIALTISWHTSAICNDDWAYSWGCRYWVEHGELRLHPASAAWGLPQVVLGTAVVWLTGQQNYTTVRSVGWALGLACVFGFYLSLRVAGNRPGGAFWRSCLVACNPMVIHMTWSFMTDLPFVLLVLATLTACVAAQRWGAGRWLLLGGVLAGLASLQRQYGIALAILPLLVTSRSKTLRWWLRGSGALLSFVVLGGVWWWLSQGRGGAGDLAQRIQLVVNNLTQRPLVSTVNSLSCFLHCLAFISLFWLPLELTSRARRSVRILVLCGLLYLLAGIRVATWPEIGFGEHPRDRVTWNYFYNLGLGGAGLHDTAVMQWQRPGAPDLDWLAETLYWLSLASGALLLARIVQALQPAFSKGILQTREQLPLPVITLLVMLATVIAVSVLSGFFLPDRYLLVCLVLAGFLYHDEPDRQPPSWWPQTVVCVLLAVYGVAGTIDFWRWNGARWHAIAFLQNEGVAASQIDGGYEYHAYKTPVKFLPDGSIDPAWETYWVHHILPYRIEFNPGEHSYQTIGSVPFKSPLYPHRSCAIYINRLAVGLKERNDLKRPAAARPPSPAPPSER